MLETSVNAKTRLLRSTFGFFSDTVFDASPRLLSRFDSHVNNPDCRLLAADCSLKRQFYLLSF
jgi:hypothetical protein